jgi:hypothetical protein
MTRSRSLRSHAGARPTDAAAKRPEKAIQAAVLAFLAKIPGVHAFPFKAGMFRKPYIAKDGTRREHVIRTGKPGISDILGWREERGVDESLGMWIRARFLAIEVKRPGENPTPEQQAFLERVKRAGGLGFVARSVDDVAHALGLRAHGITAERARGAALGVEPGSRSTRRAQCEGEASV